MSSFMSGLSQGYGIVRDMQNQERQARMDELAETRYQAGIERADEEKAYRRGRDEVADARHEAGIAKEEERYQIASEKADEERKYQRGRQARQDKANEEHRAWQVKNQERLTRNEEAKTIFTNIAAKGEVNSPAEIEALQGTPFDLNNMTDENIYKMQESGQYFTKMLSGDMGTIPEDDPEFLMHANRFFGDKIKSSIGETDPESGKKIDDVQVVGFYPVEGQAALYAELEVKYADGSTAKKPWTEGRTSDPDDPVRPIGLQNIMSEIDSRQKLIEIVNQPEVKANIQKVRGAAGGSQAGISPNTLYTQNQLNTRQYRTALTSLNKDKAKELAKIQTDPLLRKPEDKQAAIDKVESIYKTRQDEIESLYQSSGGALQRPEPATKEQSKPKTTFANEAEFKKALKNVPSDVVKRVLDKYPNWTEEQARKAILKRQMESQG